MDRDADSSRNSDSEILAQLRRRSAASSARRDDGFSFEESQIVESESATKTSNEDRAEALKRLVASKGSKEATSSLSTLSSTIRGLREELNSDVASYAASQDMNAGTTDASLDLVEAELESRTPQVRRDAEVSVAEPKKSETPKKSKKASSSRIDVVLPEAVSIDPAAVKKYESDEAQNVSIGATDLLVVSNLRKGYVKGKKLIPVLQGVNLTVKQGELLAVVGQSGSGKSTLLHLMGTLDVPDSGTIHFDGQRIDNLPCSQRDVLRNHFIGMIFQFYHLIPEMTTLENVLAPLMIRDSIFGYLRKRSKYVERAKELLDLVGLSHRLKHRPNELSGGEMQRASIARALITDPRVLLADEPTGNLDSKASIGVLELLRQLNKKRDLTIVMVTHDMSQARDADRAIRLVDGMVVPE